MLSKKLISESINILGKEGKLNFNTYSFSIIISFSNLILTTNVNKREASPIRDLKLYFI